MTRHIAYILLLVIVSGYALVRGGAPEKLGSAIAAIGTILTYIVASTFSQRFRHVEAGIFFVDLSVLILFGWMAIRSTRFWPIWVTGLQSIGVITHIIRETTPDIVPQAYMDAVAVWAYPILLILGAGTLRHRKRLDRKGRDPPWKPSRP